MESTTKRLNDATPSEWDRARQAYLKSIDEAIIEEESQDMVNRPLHYNQGIETWDYITSWDMGYLEGNIIKYVTRFKHKGKPIEDLMKAQAYLNKLIREYKCGDSGHEP